MAMQDDPLLADNDFDSKLRKDVETMAKADEGFLRVLKVVFPAKYLENYAPRFIDALRTASRVALWSWVTGVVTYFLRKSTLLPKAYEGRVSDVMLAIIFNATDDLASSIRNSVQSLAGTLVAIFFSFILYQLPDPHKPKDPDSDYVFTPAPPQCGNLTAPDSSVLKQMYTWECFAISGMTSTFTFLPNLETVIAFVFFAVFCAGVLSINVVMPFRVFAMLGAVKYMLTFANPDVKTAHFMDLTWDSEMTISIVMQVAGSLVAIMAVMFPPRTATGKAKVLAARLTLGTTDLLTFVTTYYCGNKPTLKINVFNNNLKRMHHDLEDEVGKLDSSWWEFFDWGNRGVVRYLMLQHVDLIKDIDRRLAIMQIAVRNETFDARHSQAIKEVKSQMTKLVAATGNLLLHCTISASDGVFDEKELQDLKSRQRAVKNARLELAKKWKHQRRKMGALTRDLRTESFFLLELDTAARQIYEYSETVTDKRPSPTWIAAKHLMKTVDREKLRDPEFLNFVGRNWISMMIAWAWAVLAYRFEPSILNNVVFMMTMIPGNAIMMNLQKLQALVLGSLAGVTMYRAFSLDLLVFKVLKLLCLFFYVLFTMFIARYSPEFANIGILLAVSGASKLLKPCLETPLTYGELAFRQGEEFKSLKKFSFSILVVSVVDLLLKPKPAGQQVQEQLITAMTTTFKYLRDFLNDALTVSTDATELWNNSQAVTDEVEAALAKAEEMMGAADSEPRFDKGPFKKALLVELAEQIRNLQLHVMCMVRSSKFPPEEGIIRILSKMKSFDAVKTDMMDTIRDTEEMTSKIVQHDGFCAMEPSEFSDVINKGELGALEGIDELMKEFSPQVKSELDADAECPLEDSIVSRVCVVAEMMEQVTADLLGILQVSVKNM